MGKIDHADATGLTQTTWQSDSSHKIGGVADLNVVRTVTIVVATADSPASWLAEADVLTSDYAAHNLALVAALSAAGNSEVVAAPGTWTLADTVDITSSGNDKVKRLTFAPGALIQQSADVDLFTVGRFGHLIGGKIYTGGSAFTKTAVKIYWSRVKVNMMIEGAEGVGTGKAIEFINSENQSCTYNEVYAEISGFEYGVKVTSTLAKDMFINRFRGTISHCENPIYETMGTSPAFLGNTYEFDYQAIAAGGENDVIHLDSDDTRVYMRVYDWANAGGISIAAGHHGIYIQCGGNGDFHSKLTANSSSLVYVDEEAGLVYSKLNRPIQHLANGAHTLTESAHSGKTFTNLGATDVVTINLPQNPTLGTEFRVSVMAAFELRLNPGAAGAIYINGAKQTDNKYISANDEGESITVIADGNGDWATVGAVGTWTVET